MSETSTADHSGTVKGSEKVDQTGIVDETGRVDQAERMGETENHTGAGETGKVGQNGRCSESRRVDKTGAVEEEEKVDQSGAEERVDPTGAAGKTGEGGQKSTAEEIEMADLTGTVDQNGTNDKNRIKKMGTSLSGSGGGEEGDIERQDVTPSSTPNTETSEDDRAVVLYEAELEHTRIELSKFTTCGLSCISVILVIMLGVLFISSFPFSLFVLLFCVDTKKACQPFKYIRLNPWKLYLTPDSVCYHLPNPPHRPYLNLLYCRRTPYYTFTIPLADIADMIVEELGVDEEGTLKRGSKLLETGIRVDYQSIVIELKPSAPSIAVPDYAWFGFRPHFKPSHTLAIFSVKDAHTFVEKAKEQMAIAP